MSFDRDVARKLIEEDRLWIQSIREEVVRRAQRLHAAASRLESGAVGSAVSAVEQARSLDALDGLRQTIRARLEALP